MINFIDVKKDGKESYLVDKKGVHLFFVHNLSAKLKVEIIARQAKVYILGFFWGRGKDNFNLETVQHHLAPETFSDLLIKGVFFDQSKFLYRGLIKIEKKAQLSHAFQKNQNLIMSKNAFVSSQPDLEIEANDVFCTHGSTTGKLDKDQLFYLKSRGLSSKNAEKLLISGFFEEIFAKIKEVGSDSLARDCKKMLKFSTYEP
ncbi:MAG: SufD family Fe-S cluster assembly protein [bacterium]|nr:SufD family Fe-S cluster assembly protein [bacterium]